MSSMSSMSSILPFDVVSVVTPYLGFVDCFIARLTCKEYSQIKQNSISSSLIRLINSKMGFDEKSNFGKELLEIVKKSSELSLGGSTIIEIINEEIYNNSDIDLYINYSQYNFKGRDKSKPEFYNADSYSSLRTLFKNYNLEIDHGFHITYMVDDYYVKTIRSKESNGLKIELVANPYDAAYRVEKNRDFSFCNNYYDGKTLYIENLDSVVNKWGIYDYSEEMINNIDFNMCGRPFDHVFGRAKKYYERGFDVYIDIRACLALCDPDLYGKGKERKSIDNIYECYTGDNKYMYVNQYKKTVTLYPAHTWLSDKIVKLTICETYPKYVIINEHSEQDDDNNDDDEEDEDDNQDDGEYYTYREYLSKIK